MTSQNNLIAERDYPKHFKPEKFAHPRIVLMMLQQAEILKIGKEVASLQAVDRLNRRRLMARGRIVEPLVLTRADGSGRSIFPVYKDPSKAVHEEN